MNLIGEHSLVFHTSRPDAEQLLNDLRAIPKEHVTERIATLAFGLSMRLDRKPISEDFLNAK